MKKIRNILFLALAALQLTSCKVEFTPNADWKEVPVVYCVLNQDDDTTWVRIQRCYLSQDNLYSYTQVEDSTNYPQGALEVKLLKWKGSRIGSSDFLTPAGDAPVAEFAFDYMERVKDSGMFSYEKQPIYASRTYHQLDTNSVYQLVVLKAATGDTLASAFTTLLAGSAKITKINDFAISKPNAVFKFTGTYSNCMFTWSPWTRARLYQPLVRFYYKQYGEMRHIDIKCGNVNDYGRAKSISANISKSTFFLEISEALKGDTATKNFVHYVDVFVDGCNEDLKAYITSLNALHSGSTNSQVYTNIDNGIGVFSSRRSMVARVPSDSAVGNGTYLQDLVDLHVGFEKSLVPDKK
ncbi:MAG: hypothetical protein MJZ51_05940 [Bacteroidales bacterium]|nr:hypothetical protein [Bacteroidales bacterium]